MKLLDHLKAMPVVDRVDFAARCETTLGHLQNVAYGYKPCGERLAIAIERESQGRVRVEETCPDADWSVIRGIPLARPVTERTP